jgi:hypothetical protein
MNDILHRGKAASLFAVGHSCLRSPFSEELLCRARCTFSVTSITVNKDQRHRTFQKYRDFSRTVTRRGNLGVAKHLGVPVLDR